MKKSIICLATFIVILIISGCTKVTERKVNSEDLNEINTIVKQQFKSKKANYIVKNLSNEAKFYEAALKINPEGIIPTFQVRFDSLSKRFDIEREIFVKDSTIKRELYVTDSTNNSNLDNLFEVTDFALFASSKYKGIFGFDVKINNNFGKNIKYVMVNCKYLNDYDTELWNENFKLKIDRDTVGSWLIRDNYDICKAGYSVLPGDNKELDLLLEKFTTITVNLVKFDDDTYVERVNLN